MIISMVRGFLRLQYNISYKFRNKSFYRCQYSFEHNCHSNRRHTNNCSPVSIGCHIHTSSWYSRCQSMCKGNFRHNRIVLWLLF